MPAWERVVPILPVRDVPAAQEWYRDVLGLAINWLWNDDFGSVGADHVELFLAKTAAPAGTWASIFVDDVDGVYERVRSRGAEILDELERKPWNVREFTVRDPDGNCFRIGQGVEDPVPRPEFSFPQEVA